LLDGEATDPPQPTFSDVPANHPFAVEIEWAAANELVEGFDDGTFRPTATLTRAESAAMFTRAARQADTTDESAPVGAPTAHPPVPVAPQATTLPPVEELTQFPDVARDHVFLVDIHTAAGLGLANGFADGTFGPEQSVLRQEVTALL